MISPAGCDRRNMSLHRRRVLALVAAGTGGVAGCLEEVPGRDGGQASGSSRDLHCPEYERREVDRVVCSTDPPEDALVFEPDPERADLPEAEIACRLENDREEPFETNFYDWSLHRHRDGEWFHLGPYAVPQPLHTLPPGETHVRRLFVDNTDLERVRPPEVEGSEGERTAARHGLGPGTYAVGITSTAEGREKAYSAAFALEGDPVPLVVPETVTDTEREGDRVVVDVESTSPDHDLDRYDLTVRRRADPPRAPHRFVDEQLYHARNAGMRAAFAHLDTEVQEIVVRGDDSQLTRELAGGRGPDFLEYDDETFELQVDPHDG